MHRTGGLWYCRGAEEKPRNSCITRNDRFASPLTVGDRRGVAAGRRGRTERMLDGTHTLRQGCPLSIDQSHASGKGSVASLGRRGWGGHRTNRSQAMAGKRLCADDSYASGTAGVCSAAALGGIALERGDCAGQWYAEGLRLSEHGL